MELCYTVAYRDCLEVCMNWSMKYTRDREAELRRLTEAVRLVSRMIEEVGPSGKWEYADDVRQLHRMRAEIREALDDLGWTRPEDWLDVANRVERGLQDLRRRIDRTTNWFVLS